MVRSFFAKTPAALIVVLILTLGFSVSAFADRSERDILSDNIDELSQTLDEMELDDTVKLKGDKTHKELVEALLNTAKDAVNDDSQPIGDVRKALHNVKLSIVNPRLAADTPPVPEGEILADLIPQLVKLGFKIAWVAIFVSFLVSGGFFIFAMDSEDRLTKARTILYYSIIGFLVITLAFAVVKAVTNIDFFAFV